MDKQQWEDRYRNDDLPWDRPTATEHLTWAIETFDIAPRKAIDIGCGTGTNVIWLAQQGFEVVGVDISESAIQRATRKADQAGAACTFAAIDFLHDPPPGGPFALAFDRGCFHSFDSPQERGQFAKSVAAILAPGGLWLTLAGSTDAPPRELGPPQRSAKDIA